MRLDVHLKFQRQAKEAFEFYKNVFKTQIHACYTYSDMGEITGDEDLDQKIAHISIEFGEKNLLMGYDVEEENFRRNKNQDTVVSLEIDTNEEVDRVFSELSQGGKILHHPSDEPWGYYAVLIDRFGVEWELMRSCEF